MSVFQAGSGCHSSVAVDLPRRNCSNNGQAVADSRDEKGITAAHLAAEMGHVDALQVLQQACCVQRQSWLWAGSGSEVALTSLIVQACYVWFLICLTWELVNRPRKKVN